VKKLDPAAPHAVLLVLDATVGQNALSQVEEFSRVAGVTGLVMTKLDGTARGGILAAIAAKYRLPVHFIGVGEGIDDLAPFAARDFARALAGADGAALREAESSAGPFVCAGARRTGHSDDARRRPASSVRDPRTMARRQDARRGHVVRDANGQALVGIPVWLALVIWVWRTERKGNGHVG